MLNSKVNLVDLDGTAPNQGAHFNDQPANDDVVESDTTGAEVSHAEAAIAGATTEERVRDALKASTDGTSPPSATK